MMWPGIAIGTALLIVALGVLGHRRAGEDGDAVDVDPLVTMGIANTGAGVALATTLGAAMYAVTVVGLIVMATGARRARRRSNG